MPNFVKETRHFGIVVSNMERSLHFYRDLLGLKIQRQMDESGEYINNMLALDKVKVKTVKLSADQGNTLVELLEFDSHKVEKLIIVTSDFHVERVKLIFTQIFEEYDLEILGCKTKLPKNDLEKIISHEEQAIRRIRYNF